MHRRRTITVFLSGPLWVVQIDDPALAAIFGQDTFPTAFTAEAGPLDVLDELSRQHPQDDVVLGPWSRRHRDGDRESGRDGRPFQ